MYERDILIIEDYAGTYLRNLEDEYPPCEFEVYAYSAWAADEIINRLIVEAEKLPPHITGIEYISTEEIIEGFILDMDYYASETEIMRKQLIFSIARDVGKDILSLFERRRDA